jgi:NhaP-type Na+/H+ or K+/H+ antiporter
MFFTLSANLVVLLAGTDPVAVSGLLNALGAPPRLSMHVSGESLLNDGSSVVLYQIFRALYFYEFELPNFGTDIGWGEGIKLFFQLAFGGAAIGVSFGFLSVLFIYLLNRRLSAEENTIQVVTTVCSAYLTYFVAEILCNSSGIIATLVGGLTIKVLGQTIINDYALTLHFWQVTGQLLTTLLFALGKSF